MSRDILDLIDHAIAGATSPDAMRWTPDAEKAADPPCRCLLCMPQEEVRAAIAALDSYVLALGSQPDLGPSPLAAAADPATVVSDLISPRLPLGSIWMAPLGAPPSEELPSGPGSSWTLLGTGRVAPLLPVPDLNELWAALRQALGVAAAEVSRRIATLARHAEDAGLVPEQPPQDPMARALWLRQHRHTGPTARQRAPRRIDPRRAR